MKVIFILVRADDNHIRGVYSSLDSLRDGANSWINIYPESLAYLLWSVDGDDSNELRWDYVYIVVGENISKFGGRIPDEKFWGKNLLELNPKEITYK